jgi:hypothetical protein
VILSAFPTSRPKLRKPPPVVRGAENLGEPLPGALLQAVSVFQRTANQEDTDDRRSCQADHRHGRLRQSARAIEQIADSALQNCVRRTNLFNASLDPRHPPITETPESRENWDRATCGIRLAPRLAVGRRSRAA